MRARLLVLICTALVASGCAHNAAMSGLPSSVSPSGPSPYVNQTGEQNGWKNYAVGDQLAGIARGHDGAVWGDSATRVYRIAMDGSVLAYTPGGSPTGPITPNPDGDVYVAETFQGGVAIAQVTPSGQIIDFPLPRTDTINSMISGSDGDIWMVRFTNSSGYIAKMTTSGSYSDITPGVFPYSVLVRGSDKNMWVLDRSGVGSLDRISTDGTVTQFGRLVSSSQTLASGPDGNLWVPGESRKFIFQFNLSTLTWNSYPTDNLVDPFAWIGGPNKLLYWKKNTTKTQRICTFNVISHSLIQPCVDAPAPSTNLDPRIIVGPDDELWAWDYSGGVDVLLIHPLVTTPSSINLAVGESTPLAVVERKSLQKSFTAVSNNPGVATVSGVGKQFTVTGVASGTTTITLSDKIGNSLDVPVTVQ